MTNPLSILLFYSRNKRRAFPVLGILALAVFGISLTLVLTGTMFDSARAFVSPYRRFIIIEPNYNNKATQIDPALRRELRINPRITELIPVQVQRTYGVALGNRSPYPVFAVDPERMGNVILAANDRISAGHLPDEKSDAVVLHSSVAKSRGLWVGDEIGREVDSDDYLQGKWVISGILDGDAVLNLMPLNRATKGRPVGSLLVIPVLGSTDALAQELDQIANDKVLIQTPAYWNQFVTRLMRQIDTLISIVNTVIVIVLSLGVGLLNVIYFRQRIGEFGLLRGIGYGQLFLARRVALEALLITGAAWVVGMGLSAAVYQVLNLLVFAPQGTVLNMFNERAISGTLPVPIFVWVFSTATVVWQLRRLDPVAVIDRRD